MRQPKDGSSDEPSTKRRKAKGKKPVRCTDDEMDYESTKIVSEDNGNSSVEESNAKRARVYLNFVDCFDILNYKLIFFSDFHI